MAASTVGATSRALSVLRVLLVVATAACDRSGEKPVPDLEASMPVVHADGSSEAPRKDEDDGATAEVVRVSIGEGGGELALRGARLRVLPGAVPAPTDFTLRVYVPDPAADRFDANVLGFVYALEPKDITFATAALLSIADKPGGEDGELTLITADDSDAGFTALNAWQGERGVTTWVPRAGRFGVSRAPGRWPRPRPPMGCGPRPCPGCSLCDPHDGTCSVRAGWIRCPGGCVDPNADGNHCGGCGKRCDADEFCSGGSCTCKCPDPGVPGACALPALCPQGAAQRPNPVGCGCSCTNPAAMMCPDGLCALLDSDRMNCGACGNMCAANQTCRAKECKCISHRLKNCSGVCVSTKGDPHNCGACGNACAAGEVCRAGQCTCPAGKTKCNNECVDTKTDQFNCGGCGTICELGSSTCVAGTCKRCTGFYSICYNDGQRLLQASCACDPKGERCSSYSEGTFSNMIDRYSAPPPEGRQAARCCHNGRLCL